MNICTCVGHGQTQLKKTEPLNTARRTPLLWHRPQPYMKTNQEIDSKLLWCRGIPAGFSREIPCQPVQEPSEPSVHSIIMPICIAERPVTPPTVQHTCIEIKMQDRHSRAEIPQSSSRAEALRAPSLDCRAVEPHGAMAWVA